MELFDFIQKFFVFLLPGIIGIYLYSCLNVQKEQHYYFVFLKMIMLSFTSYFVTDCLFGLTNVLIPCFPWKAIDIIHHIGSMDITIETPNVITAIVVALLLSCIFTKATYNNWLFKAANKLKLTRRIDNQSVWEHVFDNDDIVVIRDSVTKNTYYGKVSSFSDNSTNREIYLDDVRVFDAESNPLYDAERVYLSRAHNEFVIEVFDYLNSKEGDKKDGQ